MHALAEALGIAGVIPLPPGGIMQRVGHGILRGLAIRLQHHTHFKAGGRRFLLQGVQRFHQSDFFFHREGPPGDHQKIDIALLPAEAIGGQGAMQINARQVIIQNIGVAGLNPLHQKHRVPRGLGRGYAGIQQLLNFPGRLLFILAVHGQRYGLRPRPAHGKQPQHGFAIDGAVFMLQDHPGEKTAR